MTPGLPRILAIVGPTASGKTSLSLQLSDRFPIEIVSADSRQFYRFMDIGTAKPTAEDRGRVPHHMIDILDPSEEFSAGEFGIQARATVKEIMGRGKLPLLVGGSGLYIRAVIDGLFEGGTKDPELRRSLEDRYDREGPEKLHNVLSEVDPITAARISPSRKRHLIRALEVYYVTGKPLSAHHSEQNRHGEFETIQVGISIDRSELYKRINDRVDRMMQSGLLDEVSSLRERGFDLHCNAMNTVGYKELLEHLGGERDLGTSVELIKRNSRRFAKRQMTWFRGDNRIQWVSGGDNERLRRTVDETAKKLLENSVSSS